MDDGLSDSLRDFRLETRFRKRYTIHIHDDPDAPPSSPQRLEYWQSDGRVIGRGGQGHVLVQKCTGGSRNYQVRAVKMIPLLDERTRKRYIRELETMIRFSHDKYSKYFVKSLGWYETSHSLCIAMEYFPAGDLHTHLINNAPFAEDDCRQIISQLLRALSVMHGEGFAHRDIKPQNVLIHQSPITDPHGPWWVKLADFGISKRLQGDVAGNSTVFGTEEYMAPELFEQHKVSYINYQATDMWALGVMTVFLLTKTRLFQSRRFAYQYEANPDRLFPRDSLDACNVSLDGQLFIRSLIRPSLEERSDCREAMSDPWVNFWIPEAPMIPDNLSDASSLFSRRSSFDAGFPSNLSIDVASAAWSDETNNDQDAFDDDSESPHSWDAGHVEGDEDGIGHIATTDPGDESEHLEQPDPDTIPSKSSNKLEIFRAALDGNVQKLRRLLENEKSNQRSCRVKPPLSNDASQGKDDSWRPIFAAAANGHVEAVKLLLDSGLDVNLEDDNGYSLIMIAVINDNPPLFKLLLDRGADLKRTDKEGDNPIQAASAHDRLEMIKILIENCVNISSLRGLESDLFNSAVRMGYIEGVELLISNQFDISLKDSTGKTPLHFAAWEAHLEIAKLLVRFRADISARDESGATPTFYAVAGSHVEITKVLLSCGGDATIPTYDGWSPIHKAASGPVELMNILLANGADHTSRNGAGSTALHLAAKDGHIDMVEALLAGRTTHGILDDDGQTPLHVAAKAGHLKVVELLLLNQADSSIQGHEGKTLLYEAVSSNNLDLVKLLLENKADVSINTYDGRTPLYEAVRNKRPRLARMLLEGGAKPDTETAGGPSAMFSAAYDGELEIVKWLILFGAKVPTYMADMLLGKAKEQGDSEMGRILHDVNLRQLYS